VKINLIIGYNLVKGVEMVMP